MEPNTKEQAKEILANEIGLLAIQYRFVYQIINMTNRICVPNMKTMGVKVCPSGNFELGYDPEFVCALKDTWLRYVLYHEILHMVLGHCTYRDKHFKNKKLGNVAMDLAINQLIPIKKTFCERPEGDFRSLQIEDFKKKYPDIEEKQTAEYYYEFLLKKQESESGKSGKESGSGEFEKGFDSHEGFGESELAAEKIRSKIKEIETNNSWGSIGGDVKEMIIAANTKRIPWQSIVKQIYGNISWGERETTRKRPNRKTGYINPGYKKLMVDKHLLAIDVSASVSESLGAKFIGTMNQIVDVVPLDYMQCDSDVTVTPKPFDRKKKSIEFTGRGGTSFQPIIDLVDRLKYKFVLIFTDGEASPCTKPKNARVIWVLPEGANPPVDWGTIVHITNFN
jgi:predicted metal-dependent peptidase